MAQYNVHTSMAALHIFDTPVGYQPPRGFAVNFAVSYNQRDSQQTLEFDIPNAGEILSLARTGPVTGSRTSTPAAWMPVTLRSDAPVAGAISSPTIVRARSLPSR